MSCRCSKCGMLVDCGDTVCGICDCDDQQHPSERMFGVGLGIGMDVKDAYRANLEA